MNIEYYGNKVFDVTNVEGINGHEFVNYATKLSQKIEFTRGAIGKITGSELSPFAVMYLIQDSK